MSRRRRGRGTVHGIVLVDKPRGPTSHDVVATARKALDTPAVGHAGTLDPMATGLLVLAVGEGTKLVPWLTADDKTYEATLTLGVATDSLDADGRAVTEAPVPPGIDVDRVEAVAERFHGTTRQRAPVVSAIKQGGVTLHERVRRGERVEAPEREVRVDALTVLGVEGRDVRFRVRCGKGFYVRALGRDLAEALGTVGHLTELRRTQSGAFSVMGDPGRAYEVLQASAAARRRDGVTPEEDEEARATARRTVLALPDAWGDRTRAVVDPLGAEDVRHGRRVAPERFGLDGPVEGDPVGVFDGVGRLLAIAELDEGWLRSVRGFDAAASTPGDGPRVGC